MKTFLRALLILVALVLGALAWDVWRLRALRPPEDRSFEGFLRDGRRGSLMIDAAGQRLYWMTTSGTLMPYSDPVTYEFDRSGRLLNWSPGDGQGMLLEAPVRRRGKDATVEEARAWMK